MGIGKLFRNQPTRQSNKAQSKPSFAKSALTAGAVQFGAQTGASGIKHKFFKKAKNVGLAAAAPEAEMGEAELRSRKRMKNMKQNPKNLGVKKQPLKQGKKRNMMNSFHTVLGNAQRTAKNVGRTAKNVGSNIQSASRNIEQGVKSTQQSTSGWLREANARLRGTGKYRKIPPAKKSALQMSVFGKDDTNLRHRNPHEVHSDLREMAKSLGYRAPSETSTGGTFKIRSQSGQEKKEERAMKAQFDNLPEMKTMRSIQRKKENMMKRHAIATGDVSKLGAYGSVVGGLPANERKRIANLPKITPKTRAAINAKKRAREHMMTNLPKIERPDLPEKMYSQSYRKNLKKYRKSFEN